MSRLWRALWLIGAVNWVHTAPTPIWRMTAEGVESFIGLFVSMSIAVLLAFYALEPE